LNEKRLETLDKEQMGIDEYAVENDQIDLIFLLLLSLKIEIFK